MLDKILLVLILVLVLIPMGTGINLETKYVITDLPFNTTKELNLTSNINDTFTLSCGTCQFSAPNTSFLNFSASSLIPIKFNLSVPNGTANGFYSEDWQLIKNLTPVSNFSISFDYNVSVPIPLTFTLGNITPFNDSKLGLYDDIPRNITLEYNGSIKNLTTDLFQDGVSLPHNFTKTADKLIWEFQELSDGIFYGTWRITDDNNQTITYNYQFTIKRTEPPKPLGISPEPTIFTDEVEDLYVDMPHGNYTVEYLIYDGMPSFGDDDWLPLNNNNQNEFYKQNIDFFTQGLGQVYIKITDDFGNVVIYPTGIVSGQAVKLNIEDRSLNTYPGEEEITDVTLSIKGDYGNKMRCKMDDFTGSGDYKINVESSASIRRKDYKDLTNDYEILLNKEYDDTILLNPDISRHDLELIIQVPKTTEAPKDYESTLTCLVI